VRAKLSDAEIEANFDLEHHLKHVDTIFARVFGPAEAKAADVPVRARAAAGGGA
jgi:adenylosuccinate lyase